MWGGCEYEWKGVLYMVEHFWRRLGIEIVEEERIPGKTL